MSLSVKVRNKKSRLFDFVSFSKKELVQFNIKLEFVLNRLWTVGAVMFLVKRFSLKTFSLCGGDFIRKGKVSSALIH